MFKNQHVFNEKSQRLSAVVAQINVENNIPKPVEIVKKSLTPLEWFKLESKNSKKKFNLSKPKQRPVAVVQEHLKQEALIKFLVEKNTPNNPKNNSNDSESDRDSFDSFDDSIDLNENVTFDRIEDLSVSLEKFSFQSKPRESLAHFNPNLSFSFNDYASHSISNYKIVQDDLNFSALSISSDCSSSKPKIRNIYLDPEAFKVNLLEEMKNFIENHSFFAEYNLLQNDDLKLPHILIVPQKLRAITKFLLIGLMRQDVILVTDKWLLDLEQNSSKKNRDTKFYFPTFCRNCERKNIFRNFTSIYVKDSFRCPETKLSSKTVKRLVSLGNGRTTSDLAKATIVIGEKLDVRKICVKTKWIVDSVLNGRQESRFLYLI